MSPKEKISYKGFYGAYAITEQSKMNFGKEIMDSVEKQGNADGVDIYSGMSESGKKEQREFDEWFYSNRDMRMTFSPDGSINLKRKFPVEYKEGFGFIYLYMNILMMMLLMNTMIKQEKNIWRGQWELFSQGRLHSF